MFSVNVDAVGSTPGCRLPPTCAACGFRCSCFVTPPVAPGGTLRTRVPLTGLVILNADSLVWSLPNGWVRAVARLDD